MQGQTSYRDRHTDRNPDRHMDRQVDGQTHTSDWADVTHVLQFALTGCCGAAAFSAELQQSQRLEQSDAALQDL